jgi:hypothetical protein
MTPDYCFNVEWSILFCLSEALLPITYRSLLKPSNCDRDESTNDQRRHHKPPDDWKFNVESDHQRRCHEGYSSDRRLANTLGGGDWINRRLEEPLQ